MAIPTGKQGLRCSFEPWKDDSRKITTLESNHRQSVSEHLSSFVPTSQTVNKKMSEGVFTTPLISNNDNKPSPNGLGAKQAKPTNCFCGKAHAGGRQNCSWFC